MKVNTKSALGLGALLVAGAVALTGCGGNAESGSGGDNGSNGAGAAGTLTIWVDANRATALKDVAAAFEEDKGVAVKLVTKDFSKIQEEFAAQVPTGKGPDITVGAHDWLGGFVQNGLVAPVDLGDKAAEFQPVAVSAFTDDGKVYGLPYAIENIALMRNADLVPEAPTSFDDMIAKGTAAGVQYPFVVGLDPANADPYHLYPFQTSFGNSVFAQNADGSYDGSKLTVGDETGVAFATWLGQQGKAGTINLNLTQDLSKEAFNSGKSPFILTGPWNVADAQAKGINIAVDPIPSAGGQPARPFVGVQGFYVNAKSENTLIANEFLTNYLATEDVQTALFEAGDRAPALTSAFEKASADPIVAGFGAVGKDGVPMPSIPEMGAVWEFWGVTEAAVIKGEDPAATWAKMTADIQAKLG
ncbi:maltose ABC transporter substrate-binding protein [Microbacterium resistens]|uniref:sugar ABC transporter substrate-binding protein n=1 Tax=Microbacterium resistens TaxID=156977 RepID=UPI001C55FE25|nr:maltose ABC transporter substrate-binding protein [Microbacterium resistens]MBW1641094.1 maltose ABC transporter substrate-binding protein [Microbacterium resistens]